MASSGSFNTTGYEGRYLTFSWSLTSQSAETNTSVISWSLKGAGNASSSWYNAGNFKVVINGSTVYQSSTRIKLYNGTVVSSGSLTIPHNSDGTKTFSASAEAGIYYVAVNCSGSGSWSLPQILRYATITDAPNFTDEQDPSVSFINPTNAKLQFKIEAGGNTAVVVRDNVTNAKSPYKFTLTAAERNALRALSPNSNTLTVRFTVATYSGSSVSYWSYLDRTMTIVNANPTISGISYADTNSTTTNITGNAQQIIQNNSTVTFTMSSIAALKGANLSRVEVKVNAVTVQSSLSGSSVTNKTVSFGTINSSSNLVGQVTVTDTRGNKTSANVNITMLAWSLPTAIINCNRKNNYYTETDLRVNADYSSLDNKNTISIKYQTKTTDSSSWSSQTTIQDDVTTTISLDNSEAWDIRVIVTDRLGSSTYNLSIDRGIPIVFYDRKNRSTGFNCFPVNVGSVESNGLVLDDMIYIGSQVLLDSYTMTEIDTIKVLGSYGYDLINGLFTGIQIPEDYERAYRLSATISTTNSNQAAVGINNIKSGIVNTWSGQTMRKICGSNYFKESDIELEQTYQYTRDGTNLYLYNTGSTGNAYFYNVTIHGYLVKKATSPAAATLADDTESSPAS